MQKDNALKNYSLLSLVRSYIRNLLVSLDQLGNTLLGGAPDETISSRAGRTRLKNRWSRLLCRLLDIVDPGHCDNSIEYDEDGNPKPRHF